jgi:hypothetical protein
MSAIMSLVVSHLLTIIENELITEEPAVLALVVQEIQLLISKLENFIQGKSPAIAAALNPALTAAGTVAVASVNAASNVIENAVNTSN